MLPLTPSPLLPPLPPGEGWGEGELRATPNTLPSFPSPGIPGERREGVHSSDSRTKQDFEVSVADIHNRPTPVIPLHPYSPFEHLTSASSVFIARPESIASLASATPCAIPAAFPAI